jgi:hypothetical protein
MSKIKGENEFFKRINIIYNRDDGENIRKWLNSLKVYNMGPDSKVPGLLYKSTKIATETKSNEGAYYMIMKWISMNLDKFEDFDFENIPPSVVNGEEVINLFDIQTEKNGSPAKTNSQPKKKTFINDVDVFRWFDNPEKHPINDTYLSPVSQEYANFYGKSVKIIKKKYGNDFDIYMSFPNNHRLYGIDFLYYTFVSKDRGGSSGMPINDTIICELLKSGIDNTEDKDTILETEVELIRNRFSKTRIQNSENNFNLSKRLFTSLQERMVIILLRGQNGDFKDITINTIKQKIITIAWFGEYNYSIRQALNLFEFLKTYRFSNGKIVIDYINEIVRDRLYDNDTRKSLEDALELYSTFELVYQDIEDLLNEDSGIVDNYENKHFDILSDPLDEYFDKYEDALKVIQNPKYRNLINLATFKPTDTKLFLTESQYNKFLKNKEKMSQQYAVSKIDYDKSILEYNSIPRAERPSKSPSPPKRPTLKLENGKIYQLGLRDPEYIKKSLLKEFNEEYQKVSHLIDEYNKVKNMGYLQLLKYETKKSPNKEIKDIAKENILLQMNKEQITDEILYDYSELENKCNDETDVISNEIIEEYPLAKLQLLVRLKVWNRNKTKYKTECIYAPKLYNYLVESVNTKKLFLNPVTKQKYTDENVDELMKVMKLINPRIEKPIFLKPINDTQLKIDYRQFYAYNMNWFEIFICREFGGETYLIHRLCTIPADMDAVAQPWVTNSTDLTSPVMLFRIFALFNRGSLLENYVPPYYNERTDKVVKLAIHFNRYKQTEHWLRDMETGRSRNTAGIIEMFKHYASEINDFH